MQPPKSSCHRHRGHQILMAWGPGGNPGPGKTRQKLVREAGGWSFVGASGTGPENNWLKALSQDNMSPPQFHVYNRRIRKLLPTTFCHICGLSSFRQGPFLEYVDTLCDGKIGTDQNKITQVPEDCLMKIIVKHTAVCVHY